MVINYKRALKEDLCRAKMCFSGIGIDFGVLSVASHWMLELCKYEWKS